METMEGMEYLVPITVAALAPYLTEAAYTWLRRSRGHRFGASAPNWVSGLLARSRFLNHH